MVNVKKLLVPDQITVCKWGRADVGRYKIKDHPMSHQSTK